MCGLEEITNPPSPPETRFGFETSTRQYNFGDTAIYDDESTSSVLVGGG